MFLSDFLQYVKQYGGERGSVMTTREPPVSKTEKSRAKWAASIIFVIILAVLAIIVIAPQGPHDRPGSDGSNPTAAEGATQGGLTGRTAPAIAP